MSHNVGNGGTFGIDAYVKTQGQSFLTQPPMVLPPEYGEAPKLPPESKLYYAITDYEQNIHLNPSDAALAAILILKDVFNRNLLSGSNDQLSKLKTAVEEFTQWQSVRPLERKEE